MVNTFSSPRWLTYVPPKTTPYIQLARLHYFAGPNLLFWPFAWGLTLGAIMTKMPPASLLKQMSAYFLASLLLHSVGATWNDICDRDLDGLVERTKDRPLVNGSVTVKKALLFLVPQVWLLVEILRLTNHMAFCLGVFGLFFWVPLYPLMKRVTYWPQAWLGIAGNWGLLVACTSLTNSLNLSTAGVFFIGAWCWCMHYDTVYGMMDKKDDVVVGIKSTALLFGSHARSILSFFAVGFIICLAIVGKALDASVGYYLFSVGGTAMHLLWQLISVDFEDNDSCFSVFGSNATQLGYFVWIGLAVVYYERL